NALLALFRVRDNSNAAVTEEDIHAVLKEGSDAGVIEDHEHTIVRNVFRLDDRPIVSLMVPRRDVVYLDLDGTAERNRQVLELGEHNRMPVVRGGMHEVVGVVSTRTLLAQAMRGETLDFESQIHAPLRVPESLTGMELLQQMRSSGVQLAFVIDEYASVQGIVTQHDLLEAIAGEFSTSVPEDSWAIQRQDGSWLLDGLISLQDLKDHLELKNLPDDGQRRYHTLNGLFMQLMGRLPATTDRFDWLGWRFEVVDMDGHRIDKVLASRTLPNAEVDQR
ncbi:MAG: hemolysin family protein, partial [Dokdonella sp.]